MNRSNRPTVPPGVPDLTSLMAIGEIDEVMSELAAFARSAIDVGAIKKEDIIKVRNVLWSAGFSPGHAMLLAMAWIPIEWILMRDHIEADTIAGNIRCANESKDGI